MTEEERLSLKVGDEIRAIGTRSTLNWNIGDVITINAIHSDDDPCFKVDSSTSYISKRGKNITIFELVKPTTSAGLRDVKKDEVVLAITNYACFTKGSI